LEVVEIIKLFIKTNIGFLALITLP